MTSLAPLVYLLALGFGFNVAVAIVCIVEDRRQQRRDRRRRETARELNSRRWIFAQQIGAIGRVPSGGRRLP